VAPRLDLEAYDALVGSIYDAAVEPSLWQAALGRLTTVFAGRSAAFFTVGLDPPSSHFIATHNVAPESLEVYGRHYVTVDLWNPSIARAPVGRALASHELCPDDVLFRSEFYNDFLSAFDMAYATGGFVERQDNQGVLLGVQRDLKRGPFTPDEAITLSGLYRHVSRALSIARSFDTLTTREAALRATLDRLPTAILIVDRYGRAVIMNAAARKLVALQDGLFDEPHGLRGGSAAATGALRTEIAAASHGAAVPGSGIVRLPRAAGRPLTARITPLGRLARERLGLGMPAAAVFIDDPDSLPRPSAELLREIFGLSGAEARLVALLAEGRTLAAAADELRVSRETLRTLLRRVFDKTGTRRQSELMALVARLTAIR
jgi:DNA-binding CsgD family transcriptional regulator